MSYDIENITEEDMAWDEYSVMMGMQAFTVKVTEDEYSIYDDSGYDIVGPHAEAMVEAVVKFRESE